MPSKRQPANKKAVKRAPPAASEDEPVAKSRRLKKEPDEPESITHASHLHVSSLDLRAQSFVLGLKQRQHRFARGLKQQQHRSVDCSFAYQHFVFGGNDFTAQGACFVAHTVLPQHSFVRGLKQKRFEQHSFVRGLKKQQHNFVRGLKQNSSEQHSLPALRIWRQ